MTLVKVYYIRTKHRNRENNDKKTNKLDILEMTVTIIIHMTN